MTSSGAVAPPSSRLARLLGFLNSDPGNARLLEDAVQTALDEGRGQVALDLIEAHGGGEPRPLALRNLHALALLAIGDVAQAAQRLRELSAEAPDDPGLRFNVAWCEAALGEHEAANERLDAATAALSPAAARLKVRCLHHLGRLEEALSVGQPLSRRFPDDPSLLGALATVALDLGDESLAAQLAERAGDDPEGLAVRALLKLAQGPSDLSDRWLETALSAAPANPRVQLAKGLALMARRAPAEAAPHLDAAAVAFRTHLGSWLAAGWAYLAAGDLAASRARFERAMTLDDTFSEAHGSLAVLNLMEGHEEPAKREAEVALRLDRASFSGALAQSLLADRRGDSALGERIRERALAAPLDASGRTLLDMLAAFSRGGG